MSSGQKACAEDDEREENKLRVARWNKHASLTQIKRVREAEHDLRMFDHRNVPLTELQHNCIKDAMKALSEMLS